MAEATHPMAMRPLIPERLRECRSLLARYPFRPYYYHTFIDDGASTEYCEEMLRAAVTQEGAGGWVLEREGGVEGLVVFGPRPWESEALGVRCGFIGQVLVDPERETARADASRLIVAALESLSSSGVSYVVARVDVGELEAVHALEQRGFITLDTVLHLGVDLSELDLGSLPSTVHPCRLHRAEDLEGLRAIAMSAYRFDRLHADPTIDRAHADAAYAMWIERACAGLADAVIVAVDECDAPLGFMTVEVNGQSARQLDLPLAKIWLVGVSGKARGRGVATAMIAETLRWCAARRVRFIEVGTQLRNLPALRLYARSGFLPLNSVFGLRGLLSPS